MTVNKQNTNLQPALFGVSSADGETPVYLYADPTTHGLVISGSITASGSDGAILDGSDSNIKATVLDYTNSNPQAVRLTDTNGDYVSAGAGTQYTEDAAAAVNPVGGALIVVREDARAGGLVSADGDNVALRGNNSGELYVKHTDAIPVTDNSGSLTVDYATTGSGNATGALRVELANNGTGLVGLNAGTNAIGKLAANSGVDIGDVDITSVIPGVGATNLGKREDDAHASLDTGVMALAVRSNTAASTSGADGDYQPLITSATGHLWVDASGQTLTVASHAVTNAGTFVVQENGAALTSLQLIDDVVYTDDTSTHSTGTSKGVGIMATAVPTDTSVNANDIGMVAMTTDRRLLVDASGVAVPVTDNGGSLTIDNAALSVVGGGVEATALRVTIASDSTGVLSVDDNGGNISIDDGGNSITVDGTVTANQGTAGAAWEMIGDIAHDAAGAAISPILVGGFASAAAPADVSADNDSVRAWYLRNGAQATVLTAAGALIGGDATNGLDVDITRMSALVAGAAIIGKVGIDQTNPGTTNLVALTAETTKVIGVTRTSDGAGNLLTSNSSTYTAKFALDGNLLGTLGTAFSTAGKVDVKGADGDVFVRQTTGSNLHTVLDSGTLTTLTTLTGITNTVVTDDLAAAPTGASVPVNAMYQGLLAQTALPAAATAGNLTGNLSDKYGRSVVLPGTIRDLVGTQTTTIAASTSETTIVTAAASTFNDLTALIISNTSATAARLDFRDTTAGSILFSLYVPAGDVRGVAFNRPVPQTSVNTNWTATSSASITDLRVYAVWDKNK